MLKSKTKFFCARRLTIIGVLAAISAVLGLTPLGFIPVGPTRATIMHIPVIIAAIIEGPIAGMIVGAMFGVFSMIQAIMNPTPVSFAFLNPLVSVLPRIMIGVTAYYSYVLFKKLGRKTSLGVLVVAWFFALVYFINSFINQLSLFKAGEISNWKISLSGLLVILTAFIGYFSYKKMKDKAVDVVVSAALGTLTNTVGVLWMIYILYAEKFVEKLGGNTDLAGKIIMGIGLANGIPEVLVAMLIVTSVVMALQKKML